MWKTVVRRFIILIPQLIALSIFVFILAELMPGDPLTGLILDPDIDLERIQELRIIHGLDGPWYERYWRWLGNLAQGDWGTSMHFHIPVLDVVGLRIGNTIRLSIFSVVVLYAVSVPLGVIAGRYNGQWKEKLISGYIYFGMALPGIIFGFMLIWLFGFILGWFPMSGTVSIEVMNEGSSLEIFLNRIRHLIMPSAAIALFGSAGIVQYLRNEIVDARVSDYVLTARSKGVPINVIYNKHIFRNSILPIASNIGYAITGIFGGTVIIENLFGFNGMGRLFFSSIQLQDFSVVTFLVLFYGTLNVIGGLISDIALTVFDPRIRIK